MKLTLAQKIFIRNSYTTFHLNLTDESLILGPITQLKKILQYTHLVQQYISLRQNSMLSHTGLWTLSAPSLPPPGNRCIAELPEGKFSN